uniref:Uncharacterized protein n=1 Tax=Ignisphaera aggregans TaxID=334771 RepID=A0A7C4BAV1_9CREN
MDYPDISKSLLFQDVTDLVDDLLKHVQHLDKLLEYRAYYDPLLSLQVFPKVTLMLEYFFTRGYETLHATYDLCIVLFSDFLAIRGIRYSGKRSLSSESSFFIYKLSKQKKGSLIGKDLLGSFITEGEVLEVMALEPQMMISPFLALIRPFLKSFPKHDLIVPSPLSYITTIVTVNNVEKRFVLSPSTLTIVVREMKPAKDFKIMYTSVPGYVSNNAFLIVYNPLDDKAFEFRVPIFLVRGYDSAFDEYYEYIKKGKAIITHLLGMFIFKNGFPVICIGECNSNGMFVAFSEISPYIELEALSIIGKLRLLLSAEGSHILFQGKYYSLCAPVKHIRKMVSNIMNKIRSIEHSSEVNNTIILQQSIESIIKDEFHSHYITRINDEICMLAPPLISFSSLYNISVNDIWSFLKQVQSIASQSISSPLLSQLQLYRMMQEGTWRREVLIKLSKPWHEAIRVQQQYAEKHKLNYII